MYKICSKCQKNLELSNFYSDKRYILGVRGVCKPCMNKDSLERHGVKKEQNFSKQKEYKAKNPEKIKNIAKNYAKNNRPKVNSRLAQYRAKKLQATPSWLSAIQKAQIQEFYDIALAKTMQNGIVYEVDHIHPLLGDGFRGLHVPWNLQVISRFENRSKGNKLRQ